MSSRITMTAAMLERAIDSAADGIYVTDPGGRIIYANRAILEICGYERDLFVGRTSAVFKSGEMSAEYYARLWKTILSGRVWREVITNRRANGETYEASQTITPVVDESGVVQMFVAVQRDITREQELEQELRQVQTEVERLLAEKETLLQEVYHRAKNDLVLAESLLEIQANETSVPEVRDSLRRAAVRTAVLGRVYGLLQNSGEIDRVCPADLFSQLVDALRISTLPANVRVELDLDPMVTSSQLATALAIVVNELIMNATKYAFGATADPRIGLSLKPGPGDRVRLTFSDNGCGLPPAVLDDRDYGFGLNIARTIATQYNGAVTLANAGGAVIEVVVRTGT